MARTKIDYGIDLGTTNSAIARMENGHPVIKKSDTQKDIMPSCVFVNKKKSFLFGDSAFNALKQDRFQALKDFSFEMNAFIEFKRTMGSDKKYHCTNLENNFSSEELSAEVLKSLKSFIKDENIQSAVVTVPAKFTINQKDATRRAAELAGLKHCELLQEPIAASMAYGLDSIVKNGFWMVFDFGGGTFDAALLKVESGIMQVIDTEGDNFLGGKNLDYAIVDEVILPYFEKNFSMGSIFGNQEKKELFREAMKYYAEEAKIQLSFRESHNILSNLGEIPGEDDDGNEFELDIVLTQHGLERVLAPIFQRAVDITKELLQRNNISNENLSSLILVGGPTLSPILRKMLVEQISEKVDASIDPMAVVAQGAALYASTINLAEEIVEKSRDKTKIQLEIRFEPTTVELEEFVAIKILRDKTDGSIPERVFAEVTRGDQAWASGKFLIGEKGELTEVKLNPGKANHYHINLYDEKGARVQGEPGEFTIIQGSKVGSATLPYHIGIEIRDSVDGKLIFQPIKGLEKNQSTPAKGTINGLKTQQQIRPGEKKDLIKIPIYQGEHDSVGSRAIYNEHVFDAIISGEDLPSLLPKGSDVDLTLLADRSEKIRLQAYFPYLDHTSEIEVPSDSVQKEVDDNWLEEEISNARGTLEEIQGGPDFNNTGEIEKLEEELDYLEKRLDQGRRDVDRKKEVLDNLRRALRKIDKLQGDSAWPQLEAELREAFDRLEKVNQEFGNEQTTRAVADLRRQADHVIREKDLRNGQAVLNDVQELFFHLTFIYQLIGFVQHHNQQFNSFHWRDRNQARQILNQCVQIVAQNPNVQELHPLVIALINLLPEDEMGDVEVLMGGQ